MKRKKFLLICEEIRRERQSPQKQWSYEIGKRRQEKIKSLLQELKEGGIIRDFLQTGDLSFQDVVKGIDFIIIYIDGTYKICPLSVTGKRWLEEHKHRHPEIPVIDIAENDTAASVKRKILKVIRKKAL